jgi:hypothetical protein
VSLGISGTISGSELSITSDRFTVGAGGTQEVDVQVSLRDVAPGIYQGGLALTSDNASTQMIRLTLGVKFHNIYLPLVLKSY